MRLSPIALFLLAAGTAQAAPKQFGIHGILGFSAEVEDDKRKFKQGGVTQTGDGGDEDLESNFGIALTYEVPLQSRLSVGGRLAYIGAEGDDSDADYRTFDGGGWIRFRFADGPIQPFAAGGLGATYVTTDGEQQGVDVEASGIGWHILLGGGVTYSLGSVDLLGGLMYERQAIPEAEGEAGSADITFEDVVLSRILLVAGAMF
jgi:hypothetical protein